MCDSPKCGVWRRRVYVPWGLVVLARECPCGPEVTAAAAASYGLRGEGKGKDGAKCKEGQKGQEGTNYASGGSGGSGRPRRRSHSETAVGRRAERKKKPHRDFKERSVRGRSLRLTSECDTRMAVLAPSQPSYLRMAELAAVQPHPSARWLQHTHGSHP